MDHVLQLLKERNLLSHNNQGIRVITASQKEGMDFTKELLLRIVDTRTMLLLSGGRTPKELYGEIAKEEVLIPGAVGLIDERYDINPLHKNSNQRMLQDVGILRYLQMRGIPFHSILKGEEREKTASEYDKTLRELFSLYQKTIGILGIGLDGHTAGIPAKSSKLKVESIKSDLGYDFVTQYDDGRSIASGGYGERVTMTFLGLSMLDMHIVLVFGDDKKEALDEMFDGSSESEIPSRFYKRPEIAKKTILITDQHI